MASLAPSSSLAMLGIRQQGIARLLAIRYDRENSRDRTKTVLATELEVHVRGTVSRFGMQYF